MTKNKGIPDRWLAYKNMGKRVAGTPFIAFKVPLAEKFDRLLRERDRFSPATLVEKNPGMKLIIDLTNTQRYYTAESVERKGVSYYKLACPGRLIPTEDLISRFCDVVHDFLSGCANGQDTLIGVHCTHGVNRTGFLICSFMVRHLLIHPREAISAFELARGHHIERDEYVKALMKYGKSGRRRRMPTHGPPPTVADISDDAEEQSVQSYGFGKLHIAAPSTTTGSWMITTGPAHRPWETQETQETSGNGRDTGPDAEAGPSRKRGPNEPFAQFRGNRKGKKDKRTKKNNGLSTSGTEGEDRSDSSYGAKASGSGQEDRANANREQYHQREDPGYGCPPRQKNFWSSPSHFSPSPLQHQLQPQPQPRPGPSSSSFQPPPPPPSSSSRASAPKRGFGKGVERERDSRTGPAASWRSRDGCGGGGGGWGRDQGRSPDRDQGRSRGRGRAGADSGSSRGGGNRAWGRAGGREQGERFAQQREGGWHRSHPPYTHQPQSHDSSSSRGNE